jgi:Dimerisation domain of Zinc Transporter
VADAAAGMLVAGMIGMTGGDILVESIKQLSDSSHDGLQQEVESILQSLHDDDVVSTVSIRARQVGSAAVTDVTVEIHPDLTTTATRAVEERIEQHLRKELRRNHQGRSVIATVHAKPNLVICPLLSKQGDEVDTSWIDNEGSQRINAHDTDRTTSVQSYDTPSTYPGDETDSLAVRMFTKPEAFVSASHIEHQVRQQALMLYPKINCHVTGVNVHFTSPTTVNVECNIRLDPSAANDGNTEKLGDEFYAENTSTLGEVQKHAKELQWVLENNLQQVESARIFLDLNPKSVSSTAANVHLV